jgi:putative ABC transport system permease protein
VLLIGPAFSAFVERDLSLGLEHAGWLLGLAGLTLLVGVVSGSYPAVFVSSLKPAHVLKGAPTGSARRPRLQQILIVAQFAASIVLVVGSLVIYRQLSYIQHKEMGYSRDHIVVLSTRGEEINNNYETVRAELLRNPNILAVATSGNLPSHISSQTTVRGWEGSTEEDELPIYRTDVGYDFLEVFEVGLAAGRNFSRDFAGDTLGGAYLLNETAVRGLGWTLEEAVGKRFEMWSGAGAIVGVMKDFHMHSLHMPIQPLMLSISPDRFSYISVKVSGEDLPGTLAAIQRTYERFTPYPFDYEFFDDAFDRLYATEIKLGESFGYFTLLALLIASLGLFGLAAFTAEQRTKELGVRKVLGASVSSLVLLLSTTFTRLVLIAFVLAVPLAYISMNRWLEAFAYRIQIGPGVFLLAVCAVLLIALASVSYQAVKAARVNPVDSLKYE